LALADVNGDGKLDLLAGCPGPAPGGVGTTVFAFGGSGGGTFDSFFQPTAVEDSMTGMVLFDLNGDGKLDLLTSHDASSSMSVRFGLGNGNFDVPTSYMIGSGTSGAKGLAVAHLNNAPIGGPGFFPMSFDSFASSPTVASGQGVVYTAVAMAGQFQAPAVYGTGSPYYDYVAIGDLDGDGIPDVAALRSNGPLDSFKGNGNGGLIVPPMASSDVNTIGSSHYYATCFSLGDMNSDGILDAVVTLEDNIHVCLGTGSGSFGSFANYHDIPDTFMYRGTVLGDINSDGHLDVVYGCGYTMYRLGDGAGHLGLQHVAVGYPPGNSIALGDLNSDGYLDVVTNDGDYITPDYNIVVAFGSWDLLGTYLGFANLVVPFPGIAGAVCIADLNGDSIPDIVATDELSSAVGTVFNAGYGSFTFPQYYTTYQDAQVLLARDFDINGRPDILTMSDSSSTMSIRYSSTIGLEPGPKYYSVPTGHSFESCAADDLNGDGSPDIVVAASGKICVFLNQSSHSKFQSWWGAKLSTKGCVGFQVMNAIGDVKVGNSNFQLHCSSAPANSLGLGILTTAAIPNGADTFGIGLNLLVDLINGAPITFDLQSDGSGEGFGPIPIPNQPFLVGFTGYAQALWYWPSACNPSQLNLSSSGGVALYVHQ
jgi:hypothetical protein